MDTQAFGSVVAMEFRQRPGMAFADIVEEFDIAFQMVDSRTRALTWDCDDIALIDRDSVRVALGWLPAREKGQPWNLIVAVGAAPGSKDKIDPASYQFITDRIVERTRNFMPVNAVLQGDAGQPVSAELVDGLFDLLRMSTNDMPGDRRAPRPRSVWEEADHDAYADMVDSMSPPWMEEDDDTVTRRRSYFHSAAEGAFDPGLTNHLGQVLLSRAEPTQPLRLTIHTLALSMCLYVPPVGAAMFAYSMLRDVFPIAAHAV